MKFGKFFFSLFAGACIFGFQSARADGVFLVPQGEHGETCRLAYGQVNNRLDHLASPPFRDLAKAMDIDSETAALVRESMGYSPQVPLARVQRTLMAWQGSCEAPASLAIYGSVEFCGTHSLSGGFRAACEDMGRLAESMNARIYHSLDEQN